jgi:hypothetical protein
MGVSFCVALLLATIVLTSAGLDESGIRAALRVTARLSYVLFWPAYTASAMTALFGPTFKPFARRAREFGLAFASAHLIHIGLVVWLYRISARPPVSQDTFLFFGVALLWTYILAVFSIERVARALGHRQWRILRTVAVEYIALAFAVDFVPSAGGSAKHLIAYLPFATLAVVGPTLRLFALLFHPRRAARSTA